MQERGQGLGETVAAGPFLGEARSVDVEDPDFHVLGQSLDGVALPRATRAGEDEVGTDGRFTGHEDVKDASDVVDGLNGHGDSN